MYSLDEDSTGVIPDTPPKNIVRRIPKVKPNARQNHWIPSKAKTILNSKRGVRQLLQSNGESSVSSVQHPSQKKRTKILNCYKTTEVGNQINEQFLEM